MNSIKFWCYTAGHVLGAAMFMLEIAGVKVIHSVIFMMGYIIFMMGYIIFMMGYIIYLMGYIIFLMGWSQNYPNLIIKLLLIIPG